MDNLKYDFLSDVSEFWFFDKEFRDAVNDEKNITAVDTRTKIQELLLGVIQAFGAAFPKQILNKQKGEITNLPKSPVRKLVLDFLDSLTKRDVYSAIFTNQHVQHGNHRVDYSLTAFERDEKRKAKEMYKEGRFQEAMGIALELLRQNTKLQYNPGIIGFIANCYNKLGDYKNAFDYAIKVIELEPENITMLGVAARAAQNLELWDKALSYAEQYLKLQKDVQALGITTLAAQKLELWDKALNYAEQLLELEKGVTALGMAALAAQKLELWDKALDYAEQLLELDKNVTALGIAALAAQRLELWDKALSYAEQYLKLQKDVQALGIAALAAQRLELWDKALSYAEQLLELQKDVQALGIAALAAYKSGEYAAAIKYGNLLLETEPDNVFIQNIVSDAHEILFT